MNEIILLLIGAIIALVGNRLYQIWQRCQIDQMRSANAVGSGRCIGEEAPQTSNIPTIKQSHLGFSPTYFEWIELAYPFHQIIVRIQSTRPRDHQTVIAQLESVLARLRQGEEAGGYRFLVDPASNDPPFVADPASKCPPSSIAQ
jgi:hypothetical protein